jgi:hypothetical protein
MVEPGVEPQVGDHGHPRSHVVEHVDRREAGVADSDEVTFGQPERCPAQGMSSNSISDSQRRPLALTKWPREERTGSR